MKYLNLSKQIATLAIVALVFTACDKVAVQKSIGDAGQTLVKILGGGAPNAPTVVKNPVDFVNVPKTLLMADVRRDVQNAGVLNTTMKITVKDDPAAVALANPAYVILPAAWYTIGAATPKDAAGNYNLVLAPGEFAKEILITIPNATLLDPSTLYALGFTITNADNNGVLSQQLSVVIEIGAKNKYDGIYLNIGNPAAADHGFTDVAFPAFTWRADQQYSLVTSGAATCVVVNDDLNSKYPGYVFSNAGAGTFYGSYGLIITFNPATNAISDLWNYYGDPTKPATGGGNPGAGTGPPLYAAANGRRAVLNPAGINAQQANKDILIKHWMLHPSVVPVGPRSIWDETWKYLGPR